jgi:glycosyltransferase involved in cell wall biosynthesis
VTEGSCSSDGGIDRVVAESIGITVQSYSTFVSTPPILLARGLAELGYRVEVLSTHASDARALPYPKNGSIEQGALPFDLTHVPYAGTVSDNVLVWPTRKPFRKRYRCLVVHEDYPLLSLNASAWAARHGIPIVLVSERYYYPPGWITQQLLRLEDRVTGKYLWRKAALGVYHTRASQRFYAELGHAPRQVVVIPGVIDAQHFQRSSANLPHPGGAGGARPTELLTVARLHPYKGLEILLDAMGHLRKKGANVRLRIVGRGPGESGLRTLISRLGISTVVRLDTEATPNAAMPSIYRSADVYIQPSLREPFGMAVVEAMACGLPVVASSVGGMLDTVEEGRTGYLVPPGDASTLAARLEQLIRDPGLASTMGVAGQERAVSRFDYRVIAQEYAAWIEKIAR